MKTTSTNTRFTTNSFRSSYSAILMLVCLCLVSKVSKSSNHYKSYYDSTSCLEIGGKILNANEGVDGECKVELLWNNTVVDSLFLKEGKRKFKFILSRNEYYAIRISKKGFISRIISINTNMLIEQEGIYKFTFDTELINDKFAKELNDDALDFPIAIIYFNNEAECFDYSREYTSALKKELYSGNQSRKNIYHNL